MRKFFLLGAVVAALFGVNATARAADVCRSMLMPVVELKQVSRGFGHMSGGGFHSGVDLTARYGSVVRAASAGVVTFEGSYFGYGNMIDVRHEGGVVTRYAHLSAFAHGLRVGSPVVTGMMIGNVGTSGHAHGAHLHFEVRMHGVAIDPKPFLALAPCILGPQSTPIEEARAPEHLRTDPHAPQIIYFPDTRRSAKPN